MLHAALIMTAVSFVLVGASPRSVGRAHAGSGAARSARRSCDVLRILLGPLANGLVVLGNRVTPGRIARVVVRSPRSSCSAWSTRRPSSTLHRRGRPRAHPLGLRVHRHRRARGDGAAHRHGHGRCLGAPRAQAMAMFLEARVSRASPIVDDDADDVIGVLYLKDLVQFGFRDGRTPRRSGRRASRAPRCSCPSR